MSDGNQTSAPLGSELTSTTTGFAGISSLGSSFGSTLGGVSVVGGVSMAASAGVGGGGGVAGAGGGTTAAAEVAPELAAPEPAGALGFSSMATTTTTSPTPAIAAPSTAGRLRDDRVFVAPDETSAALPLMVVECVVVVPPAAGITSVPPGMIRPDDDEKSGTGTGAASGMRAVTPGDDGCFEDAGGGVAITMCGWLLSTAGMIAVMIGAGRPETIDSSRACTSAMVCGRATGSFSSIWLTSDSSGGSTSGTSDDSLGGASMTCAIITSPAPGRTNGGRPATISKRMQPSA